MNSRAWQIFWGSAGRLGAQPLTALRENLTRQPGNGYFLYAKPDLLPLRSHPGYQALVTEFLRPKAKP